ncbi:hypothetical protein FRC12_009663 [Ceratobasidium sp. 428]|nr:hypothetical protein FRC12_009663 [Ceratobasidium sp. 428]
MRLRTRSHILHLHRRLTQAPLRQLRYNLSSPVCLSCYAASHQVSYPPPPPSSHASPTSYLTRYAASHRVSYPPPALSSHASSTLLAPIMGGARLGNGNATSTHVSRDV